MSKNELSNWPNVAGGMSNLEIDEALSQLIELTGQEKIAWQATEVEAGLSRYKFKTRDLDGFEIVISQPTQDVELTISEIVGADGPSRLAGRVDSEHPPELRDRAVLAGKVLSLLILTKEQS